MHKDDNGTFTVNNELVSGFCNVSRPSTRNICTNLEWNKPLRPNYQHYETSRKDVIRKDEEVPWFRVEDISREPFAEDLRENPELKHAHETLVRWNRFSQEEKEEEFRHSGNPFSK